MRLLLFLSLFSPIYAGPTVIDMIQTKIYAKCKSTLHDFIASPQKFELQLELDESNAVPTALRFSFLFQDLKTGEQKRDKEMLVWLSASKFPELSFQMSEYQGDANKGTIKGILHFHNQSKEIYLPVLISNKSPGIRLHGNLELDHRDFGLPIIKKMLFLTVEPKLQIEIEIHAKY